MSRDAVVVVVQARMSSVRMPGKVLAPLAGEPALARLLARARRAVHAARLVVATSGETTDDPIEALCGRLGVVCVRGPLDDVLRRFVLAVPDGCGTVVRLTGDCPLVDPALVDRHVEAFLAERGVDYASNAVERTMPDGLDVEVFSRAVLLRADREATSAEDREHCTPWIRRHGVLRHVRQAVDLSALRWTLDTPRDHERIAAIHEALDEPFDSSDVYRLLLRRPEWIHVAGEAPPDEATRAALRERIARHLEEPT